VKQVLWLIAQIVMMLVMWAIVIGMFAAIIIAVVGNPFRGWMW